MRTLLPYAGVERADNEEDTYMMVSEQKHTEGNEIGYAVSQSPQHTVPGSSCWFDKNRLFTPIGSSIDKF